MKFREKSRRNRLGKPGLDRPDQTVGPTCRRHRKDRPTPDLPEGHLPMVPGHHQWYWSRRTTVRSAFASTTASTMR
ncbi:hypothetical protein T10_4687 [Trichinella papuae]|uniref:Uncharacterized protein n=1 Tax=Trichinella papuae TaxID=268474 RepID=A0A0V1MRK2_9BILA|nr:hypothetical protein T10_4687 [Trichinella papuae]